MLAVAVVATTVKQHRRPTVFLHQVEHVMIASPKIVVFQTHLTKAIVHMWVGPSDPKDQGRIKFFDGRPQGGFELIEVFRARHVPGKRYIQAASSLSCSG